MHKCIFDLVVCVCVCVCVCERERRGGSSIIYLRTHHAWLLLVREKKGHFALSPAPNLLLMSMCSQLIPMT